MKKNEILVLFCLLAISLSSCDGSSDSSSATNSSSGQGGSMARFTIEGDYMYLVSNDSLKVIDVATASQPRHLNQRDQRIGWSIETIFARDSLLFIGSQDGMYLYDISYAGLPQVITSVSHIRSCDPVVSDGKYAYVTLNSQSTWCGGQSNQLLIYDIRNPKIPLLVYEGNMTNPKGLGVDSSKLFVCDNGIRVYDVSNPASPKWMDDLSYISEADSAEMYDVIPNNRILIAVSTDGLYQFDYSESKMSLISKIDVKGE